MKDLLKKISLLAVQLNRAVFTDEQRNSEWLGNIPAQIEEIKLTEKQIRH
jgi:hypothetical protein